MGFKQFLEEGTEPFASVRVVHGAVFARDLGNCQRVVCPGGVAYFHLQIVVVVDLLYVAKFTQSLKIIIICLLTCRVGYYVIIYQVWKNT